MTIVTTEQAQKLLDEAANRLGLLNLFDAAPDLAHSLIAVYEELAVMRVERDGILAANRGLVRLNECTEARAETAEAQLATANATITQMTANGARKTTSAAGRQRRKAASSCAKPANA